MIYSKNIVLTDLEIEVIGFAAELMHKINDAKDDPSKIRKLLVELQVRRFEIGNIYTNYSADARSSMSSHYIENKTVYKMSPNAAYKDAEMSKDVVAAKNNRDFVEIAYETIKDFVSTNQSSLKIAAEEAKNTL